MSLILRNYNCDENKEYCWYDSSNVFYSECLDVQNGLKQLKVVFNNGSSYLYKDVDVNDYLMFSRGGLDGSQGKSLNKYIKPKYDVEKLDKCDLTLLTEKMNNILKQNEILNTYFISGHRDITEKEFKENYVPIITDITNSNEESRFIMGDYDGVDFMAQNLLIDVLNINPNRITVFHMGATPNKINPKIVNTIGGFESDEERDAEMTKMSSNDIAFVRNHMKWSGTAQNILRRFLLKK